MFVTHRHARSGEQLDAANEPRSVYEFSWRYVVIFEFFFVGVFKSRGVHGGPFYSHFCRLSHLQIVFLLLMGEKK
jgi:hypothetical protein